MQVSLGTDAVTAGGGGGGSNCLFNTDCGGGGTLSPIISALFHPTLYSNFTHCQPPSWTKSLNSSTHHLNNLGGGGARGSQCTDTSCGGGGNGELQRYSCLN